MIAQPITAPRPVTVLGPDPRVRRWHVAALGCLLAIPMLLVLGVGIGSRSIPPPEVVAALTHRSTDPVVTAIISELRLPRALVAMTAGGMLGLAGALLQTVLINPLIEPTLVGISPGAVLAIVLWGIFGPHVAQAGPGLALVAIAGGLLAGGVVYLLGGVGRGGDPTRLVLTGVLAGALFEALTALLLLTHTREFGAVLLFTVGSLEARTWSDWSVIWPWAIASLTLGLATSRYANALHLGDEVATNLGVPVTRCRSALLLIGVMLTAAAVSVVGALAFLGLVAPHFARLVTGSDARRLFPLSMLIGSVLLLGSDVIARVVTTPAVPVGTVVAVIGAPLLAWLLTRRHTAVPR